MWVERLHSLPRRHLTFLPTPLTLLPRLGQTLGGAEIWIKRDDQSGLASGGNKSRKLEFLVGEALAAGCDTLLTAGAAQSNHCRQSAAAAAACGLDCVLVLGGEAPVSPEGNVLLDELLGAEIHWTPRERRGERLVEQQARLEAAGRRPYLIPYGGSTVVGAVGYAAAALELFEQLEPLGLTFDRIVVATSSGGTLAGLVAGQRLTGMTGRLHGILIDKEGEPGSHAKRVAALAGEVTARLGAPAAIGVDDFAVSEAFLGGGYGIVGPLERGAIRRLARREGILLDPVYSARAFGALLALLDRGDFGQHERILFWHTGGFPALFADSVRLLGGEPR